MGSSQKNGLIQPLFFVVVTIAVVAGHTVVERIFLNDLCTK